jgi:Xaa-Pro aminopeptidase/Xaa-Pro dipeptidase
MLDRLRDAMRQHEIQMLWVSNPANVRYLSNFTTPKDGKVLVTLEDAFLITDDRYLVQSELESSLKVKIARFEAVLEFVGEIVQGHPTGFEADDTSYKQFDALRSLNAPLRPVEGLVETLRAVKTPDELALIGEAARLNDLALARVLPKIVPGALERDIALELEIEMRRAGAEACAFEITVASGERSAMPHGGASSKAIGNNELVTVDMGAIYQGYLSDMTRTFAIGDPGEELKKIHRIVAKAHRAALEKVRAGVKAFDVDFAAREIITSANYGEYFGHSVGHGVGLSIHEFPSVSYRSEDLRLEAGMVITIEPGIYLPGQGGVRIEDLIVVTTDGFEFLSRAPHNTV